MTKRDWTKRLYQLLCKKPGCSGTTQLKHLRSMSRELADCYYNKLTPKQARDKHLNYQE